VAINNNHCTPLHAHIGNEKKGFHKNQGYGGHYYTKCEKAAFVPLTKCTNQPLKVMELGAYETNAFPMLITQ
jgi:hypothetical protein